MRIGVVSDTHDRQPSVERIVELFNRESVERVVHTGDITTPETLELLGELAAPMYAVYGNNDLDRAGLLAVAERRGVRLSSSLELEWAERRILAVHDPQEVAPEGLRGYELFLHGHTHRRVIEERGGVLVLNPGESAGESVGYNAVAIVDLESLEVDIVRF